MSKIDNNSDFGLRHVLSLISPVRLKINAVSHSNIVQNFNILPDTIFESQDFKHSYLSSLFGLYFLLLLLFLFSTFIVFIIFIG